LLKWEYIQKGNKSHAGAGNLLKNLQSSCFLLVMLKGGRTGWYLSEMGGQRKGYWQLHGMDAVHYGMDAVH
ncbi:MAG: hypothetical protein RPU59_15385, partial [Candidatus Sedimenticola sp. (ex Thyasira tokunagai)]